MYILFRHCTSSRQYVLDFKYIATFIFYYHLLYYLHFFLSFVCLLVDRPSFTFTALNPYVSPWEQRLLYASILIGGYKYYKLSYKHYWLEKYLYETDPLEKGIIEGKYPFVDWELKYTKIYLERYGKSHRKWLYFPLAFTIFEIGQVCYMHMRK